VDSTCSVIVVGTAGLFSLRGTEPVIATVMMQGEVGSCMNQAPVAAKLCRAQLSRSIAAE
jgi:hypothetical protein